MSMIRRSFAAAEGLDPLGRLLAQRRTVVMGVLNVTPDSFSDGGQFVDPDTAIAHARRMAAEGAATAGTGAPKFLASAAPMAATLIDTGGAATVVALAVDMDRGGRTPAPSLERSLGELE